MELNLKKVLLIMARKCMNDREMLKQANLSTNTWSQIKSGKCKAKIGTIGKIAKGLGVDVTEIIED